MIQLSPDTQIRYYKQSYPWAAGYQYRDPTILGFSHTHFSGAGHSDLGDILTVPVAGDVRLDPGDQEKPLSGYRSRFSHDSERAEPGYYAVTLSDYGVRAELTASTRVGLHRYTFPADKAAHILVDMRSSIYDYPGKVLWSRIRVRPDGVVTGYRETRGWAPGRQLYFAMRFSRALVASHLYNRESGQQKSDYNPNFSPWADPDDVASREGRGLVAVFDFGVLPATPLLVKVAISAVSEENALRNLDEEAPGWDFDTKRAAAAAAWRKALAALDIEAPEPMRRSLCTALYHALMAPGVMMDVDGSFRGPDHEVHHAEGFTFRSTFSLWDTYRALHPLLILLRPQSDNNDFIRSLLASWRYSPDGLLPVWQFAGQETWTMIGYHAVPVIADAYLKGIRGYAADEALQAMVASASNPRYAGLDQYMKLGWVPADKVRESASKTVEYAYDDWTIGQMARAMGREDLASRFAERANNWRNVFDEKTGFMRARNSDGKFREPFDPAVAGNGDYTEGNAWQYSWYAPQDTAELIRRMGGDQGFVRKLDELFDTKVDPRSFASVEDISGLIGFYAHGNEPSHHIGYLYVYAGSPWRTQQRLAQIVRTQYRATPDGLAGNDDLGQMSAWLLFTALGFYPVTPGSGEYVIGRPFVSHAVLHLPNGKQFTIMVENLSEANGYVGSVRLNDKPLARSFLRHEEIVAGGELHFVMQPRPDKHWGSSIASRPFSLSTRR
jgi:predicted alpha-1,2-mannosidase